MNIYDLPQTLPPNPLMTLYCTLAQKITIRSVVKIFRVLVTTTGTTREYNDFDL